MTNQPFHPSIPEKEITCTITTREAHVIKILRSRTYGQFVIHKLNGRLVRIEVDESILIDEEKGLDIGVAKV